MRNGTWLSPDWRILRHFGYFWQISNASVGIFWNKGDRLADSNYLPAPGVIALEQFKLIAADLTEDAIEYIAACAVSTEAAGQFSLETTDENFLQPPARAAPG
jgi:hypothetical protein